MWVKIVKWNNHSYYWYHDEVGQIFEVEEYDSFMFPKTYREIESRFVIKREDCEIFDKSMNFKSLYDKLCS